MIYTLLLAGAAFSCYIAAVLVLVRLLARHSPVAAVIVAAPIFYVLGLFITLASGYRVLFWAYTAAFWCPALTFLMIFGAVYKSVSLRMLAYLLDRPGYSERYDALMEKYVTEESFENRLGVIQESGFAVRLADGFVLTDKGRAIARAVRRLHMFFSIERSG